MNSRSLTPPYSVLLHPTRSYSTPLVLTPPHSFFLHVSHGPFLWSLRRRSSFFLFPPLLSFSSSSLPCVRSPSLTSRFPHPLCPYTHTDRLWVCPELCGGRASPSRPQPLSCPRSGFPEESSVLGLKGPSNSRDLTLGVLRGGLRSGSPVLIDVTLSVKGPGSSPIHSPSLVIPCDVRLISVLRAEPVVRWSFCPGVTRSCSVGAQPTPHVRRCAPKGPITHTKGLVNVLGPLFSR